MTAPTSEPPGDRVGLRGCQLVRYADFADNLTHYLERAYRGRVSVDVEQDGERFVTIVATEEYDKLVRLAAWAETAREGSAI